MSVQTATIVRPSPGGGLAFLNNLRIGPKIIAGYLLLILMMAGIASLAFWGMTRITEADQLALEHQASIADLWAMQTYLSQRSNLQDEFAAHNEQALIEDFRASDATLAEKKATIREGIDHAEEQQLLADIDRIDAQLTALFFEQVVPASEAQDKALLQRLDEQSEELQSQMQDKVQQLSVTFQADVVEVHNVAEEAHRQTVLLMLVISVIASIFGLIFGIFLARSISNPIQNVAQAATRLAEGDVDQELTLTGQDEIGQMANAFRQMITYQQQMAQVAGRLAQGDLTASVTPQSDKDVLGNAFSLMITNLHSLIGQVAETANTVGAASGQVATAAEQAGQASQQVAGSIQQIAQGTSQQTQSVTEATSNVQQMARASEGIARGAQEQAQSVEKTSELAIEMAGIVSQVGQVARSVSEANAKVTQAARSGVSAVGQTGQGMDTIRARTLVAADKVKEMGNRSKEISRIVETIDDIADKTDMLALNAAVEAARAGEHGRGFAVVADQVRKLSEDSKAATRDIGELIERVQETIREAIGAMESTATEVDNGTRLAGDTARSLEEILQAAEGAAALAEQIAGAVVQLRQKSEGVVAAVEAVSTVVEENTAVAEEMAANSQEVTQAMEAIASVAEENSAAAEEVSASAEEMSAQVEEVVASAQELASLAEQLSEAVAQFRTVEDGFHRERPSRRLEPASALGQRQRSQPALALAGQSNGQ